MKSSKKLFLILIAAVFITTLMSCDPNALKGDIPKTSMSIPSALTSGSGSRTTAGGTAAGFFEPFRNSLQLAEQVLDVVNEIIDSLNNQVIPDSWEGEDNDGNSVIITTDTSRAYSKQINFTSPDAASPFLQINYNPGSVKGTILYKEEDISQDLEFLKIFYDETGAYPVLKGWITVRAGAATETYAMQLYFNATQNSDGNILFEGGVNSNFGFGGDATYCEDVIENRIYMFKSITNSTGEKAKVALYFPEATSTVNINDASESEDVNIRNAFLDILFEWLATANNINIDVDLLGMNEGDVTDGATLGTALEDFTGTLDDSIAFVLSMNNPIAYDATDGYVGNTDNSETDYPTSSDYNLGDLSSVSFSLTPAQIAAIEAETF